MDSAFLFAPAEQADGWLTALFDGAPLIGALGLAVVLGLRHASDPDHLVAVTSLMASDEVDSRRAVRLGAWWGLGHAATLLAIGLPMIAFQSALPAWLAAGAETAVGAVIIVLAGRVVWKWVRGDYRAGVHHHEPPAGTAPASKHRHLRDRAPSEHGHVDVRTPHQAFGIGVLHGLAGSGAVVLLLIAALPTQLEAAAALAVFAPMSIISMATLTGGFAWILTRPAVDPIYRRVLIPALGLFGVAFGLSYAGVA